jgi:putative transposase
MQVYLKGTFASGIDGALFNSASSSGKAAGRLCFQAWFIVSIRGVKPSPFRRRLQQVFGLVVKSAALTDYRHDAHPVFGIHLHLVWVTKYRKPVMTGEVGLRSRELIGEIYGVHEVTIMKGHISKDQVRLIVGVPPQVTLLRLVQMLKGKSSSNLLQEFPHLRKKFWERHLWAGSCF